MRSTLETIEREDRSRRELARMPSRWADAKQPSPAELLLGDAAQLRAVPRL